MKEQLKRLLKSRISEKLATITREELKKVEYDIKNMLNLK